MTAHASYYYNIIILNFACWFGCHTLVKKLQVKSTGMGVQNRIYDIIIVETALACGDTGLQLSNLNPKIHFNIHWW